MPYIEASRRADFEPHIRELRSLSLGELNYVITKLLLSRAPTHYADYAELIGVLETCKLELYRRAVAPFEDKKISENGDVY